MDCRPQWRRGPLAHGLAAPVATRQSWSIWASRGRRFRVRTCTQRSKHRPNNRRILHAHKSNKPNPLDFIRKYAIIPYAQCPFAYPSQQVSGPSGDVDHWRMDWRPQRRRGPWRMDWRPQGDVDHPPKYDARISRLRIDVNYAA